MIRKIIEINTEKCTGCGLCVDACHEGAIGLKDGKAVLLRDDYCDGLGDCLPTCPVEAISFTLREAGAYDHAAVIANKQQVEMPQPCNYSGTEIKSHLTQWPVQLKLAPLQAPYFQNASLLIAADCTAYAYANFHEKFIADHVTLIGCPKLDSVDYSEKLTQIISQNNIRDILIVRMEILCRTVIISTNGKLIHGE